MVVTKECAGEGCSMFPSFGAPGNMAAEFCAAHAPKGMYGVKSKKFCPQRLLHDCVGWRVRKQQGGLLRPNEQKNCSSTRL